MKLSNKLISCNIEKSDGTNIFGFKIFNNESAKNYLKAVKLLENNNSEFMVDSESVDYQTQLFTVTTVSNSDLKTLSKFFDIDFNDTESNTIGFLPNAIEDAYDEYLYDEEESEEEPDDYYDEDEYY